MNCFDTAPLYMSKAWRRDIITRYKTGRRVYHNFKHIQECLACWSEVETHWQEPCETFIALLYHDIVYDPLSTANESTSAQIARESTRRYAPITVNPKRVFDLVLLTAKHGELSHVDQDTALFLDCDMAILGSKSRRYNEYVRGIESEYVDVGKISQADFIRGRLSFLAKLVERPRIFLSDYFHKKLDLMARKNMKREIASLSKRLIVVKKETDILSMDNQLIEQYFAKALIEFQRELAGISIQHGRGMCYFELRDKASKALAVTEHTLCAEKASR